MVAPCQEKRREMKRERLFHLPPDRATFGTCDGLTVDAEGTVYSARWGGRAIYTYHPDGSPRGKFDLPVANVTSMCFGGKDLRDLYVTTAANGDQTVNAGALFLLRTDAKGQLDFRSNIPT